MSNETMILTDNRGEQIDANMLVPLDFDPNKMRLTVEEYEKINNAEWWFIDGELQVPFVRYEDALGFSETDPADISITLNADSVLLYSPPIMHRGWDENIGWYSA